MTPIPSTAQRPALSSHRRLLRAPLGRIGRLLYRFALALVALVGATPTTAQEVTVQVTAFQVPELTIGLETWSQSLNDDAALYERLVRLAALGEAQIVLDQRIVTRSRQRVKSEARSEYIYPTEFEPIFDRFLHLPTAFETRNLGVLIEAEATVGHDPAIGPSSFTDLALSAKRVRLKGQLPLSLPDLNSGGQVTGTFENPVFLAEEISPMVTLFGGRPLMVGLCRPADQYDEQPGGAAQQVILTFARASVAGDASPAPRYDFGDGPLPIRLHSLTIRAPLVTAAQLVWNHDPASAEDEQRRLLELVRSGTAHIVSHSAATANSGHRAKIQSISELIYPTEYDRVLPHAFETRNVGSSWEVEATLTPDGRSLSATILADQTGLPIWRGLALKSGDSPPELLVPDFRSTRWHTMITLLSGETCLVAAISPWNEDDESDTATPAWLDVSFVQSVPPSRSPSPTSQTDDSSPPRTTTGVAVFSVTEETAASLQADKSSAHTPAAADPPTIEALWAATITGQVRLLGFAHATQLSGYRFRVEEGREWICPEEAEAAKSDPEFFIPTSWEMWQSGTSLRAEVISGDRSESGTINLEFYHHIANPTLRTVEEMQAALASNRKVVPDPTIHLITIDGEFDYTLGHPQILAIDPSPAPPGHPEHGRWMVTVLKVSSGR